MIMPSSLKAQAQVTEKASANAFVQQFYDWYVPIYNKYIPGKRDQVPSEKVALTKKKDCFDTKLFTALSDYYTKPAPKGAEDVMGIDMDPFLSAQDSGAQYMCANVKQVGNNYFVDIRRDSDGKSKAQVLKGDLAVTAEITKVNGQWKFVNFLYQGNTNLLSMIASYNKEVKQQLLKKH